MRRKIFAQREVSPLKAIRRLIVSALLVSGSFFGAGFATASAAPTVGNRVPPLEESVRHALVMLPYYTVFDELSFTIDDNGVVTLMGAVTQPYKKDYAEKAVKDIEGVNAVNDQIEVLPLSRFDDDIRMRTLRALRSTASLYRYFLGTNPSIRIIVKNGRVTLDGFVQNAMDRQLAFMAANRVHGVFAVTNNLRTGS